MTPYEVLSLAEQAGLHPYYEAQEFQIVRFAELHRKAVLTEAIQKLHQNPYSLTKGECIDELRLLHQDPET